VPQTVPCEVQEQWALRVDGLIQAVQKGTVPAIYSALDTLLDLSPEALHAHTQGGEICTRVCLERMDRVEHLD
jgi:hypothetical protein